MSKNTAKKNAKKNSDAAPAAIVPSVIAPPATETPAVVVNSTAASELSELNEKLAELNRQKKEIEEKEIAAREESRQKERDLVDSLMVVLGVDSLDAVIERINARQRMDAKTKHGNVISDETKSTVDALLRAGQLTAKEISETHNVSIPWIQLRKKSLGLVKARTAAPATA